MARQNLIADLCKKEQASGLCFKKIKGRWQELFSAPGTEAAALPGITMAVIIREPQSVQGYRLIMAGTHTDACDFLVNRHSNYDYMNILTFKS